MSNVGLPELELEATSPTHAVLLQEVKKIWEHFNGDRRMAVTHVAGVFLQALDKLYCESQRCRYRYTGPTLWLCPHTSEKSDTVADWPASMKWNCILHPCDNGADPDDASVLYFPKYVDSGIALRILTEKADPSRRCAHFSRCRSVLQRVLEYELFPFLRQPRWARHAQAVFQRLVKLVWSGGKT